MVPIVCSFCVHHNHLVLQANIVRHNEEALKKINKTHNETLRSNYSGDYEQKDPIDGSQLSSTRLSLGSGSDDSEMPMPPLALASLQTHSIRYKLQRHFVNSVWEGLLISFIYVRKTVRHL